MPRRCGIGARPRPCPPSLIDPVEVEVPKRLLQDVHRHRPQPADLGAQRRDLAALAGEIEGSAGPPPVPPLFQREGVDEPRGADLLPQRCGLFGGGIKAIDVSLAEYNSKFLHDRFW